MRYLPLFADLKGRTCLLVGEGNMIEEKSEILKNSGAVIRKRACFSEDDAGDVFLIVADVEDEVASRIQEFGEKSKVFVNIVDKPKYCSFIAISTAGKSPALAGWIRERFQKEFGSEYGVLLDVLGETRETVKQVLPSYGARKTFYRELLKGGILRTAQRGGKESVRIELDRHLEKVSKKPLLQKRT
ncbi:MAG: precorrin-2 dehydrogenase/sirohydrochlorin ferrochelatase family protein [bacterium]